MKIPNFILWVKYLNYGVNFTNQMVLEQKTQSVWPTPEKVTYSFTNIHMFAEISLQNLLCNCCAIVPVDIIKPITLSYEKAALKMLAKLTLFVCWFIAIV